MRYGPSAREYARPSDSGQSDFVALFESDDRFFPIGGLAGLSGALPAKLAANIQGIYAGDLDLEKFLNGLPDLCFVRARIGDDSVLVVFLALARAFFRQANSSDNFERFHGER